MAIQYNAMFVIAVAVLAAFRSAAQEFPPVLKPDVDQSPSSGVRLLEEGRTTFDEKTLIAATKKFNHCVQEEENNAVCHYNLARAEGYLEQIMLIKKDKKAAEQWVDSAIFHAQRAISLQDNFSDAHALLADLYGNKIGLGGIFAGARLGPKVNAECERALQLNPNNAIAYTVQGHKFYFTPRMFGGSLDKAIESLRKAASLDPTSDEAFVWLAIAYRKKGDKQAAATALRQALQLNPRSAFAKRIESGGTVDQ